MSDLNDSSTKLLENYHGGVINYGNVSITPSLTDSSNSFIDVTKVYKRRWYILLLFSLLSMIQNMIWNTWSPISISAEAVFKWTTFDFGLFVNWGTICFVVFLLPFAWLINTKGLRISVLVAAFTTTLGAALRCFTTEQIPATWLVNIGQFLNGVGGPVIMSIPSAISSVWFPEFQRTTATAIGTASQGFGVALSFLVGPLLVTEPNMTASIIIGENSSNSSDTFDLQRKEIMNLLYSEFGFAVAVFFLIAIYFPNIPPKPPTMSASVPRFNFKEGFCKLMRNRKFWLICVSSGIFNGFLLAITAVLGPFLADKGFSQVESGWLGFYALLAAQVGGLILSWFLDKLSQKMKLTIVIFKIIYFAMGIWLLLIWRNFMSSKVYIYVAYIILSVSNLGLIPIFYELSIESMYPINEGVITGILNMFVNGFMVIFLGLQMILSSRSTSRGNEWMIWCLLVSVVVSLPTILFFKGIYSRLHVDKSYRKSVTSQK